MKNLKLVAAFSALTLFFAGTVNAVTPSSKLFSSADSGEIQTDQIAECLVEAGASLDVMLLMDASSSLDYGKTRQDPGSDPDGKRLNMITSALNLLFGLAKQKDIPLWVNVKTFGKAGDQDLRNYSLPWTQIDSDADIETARAKANYDGSGGTDWLGGLKEARTELTERANSAQNSCQLMIWVTDGVLNSSGRPAGDPDREQNRSDINAICSPESGVINWFRSEPNNVLVLGGLLEPKQAGDKTRSQVFTAIVEGEVTYAGDSSYFGGAVPKGKFECGSTRPGLTLGTVVKDEDPTELAWKFVDLVAKVKSLVELSESESESEFVVDNETALVEIFTKATNADSWKLFDGAGVEICSPYNSNDICEESEDSGDIITITVEVPKDFESYGNWEFRTASGQMKAFGSVIGTSRELELKIFNPSNLTDGEQGFVEVSVLTNGEDFDGEGFTSVEIQVSTDTSDSPGIITEWSGGTAPLAFSTDDKFLKASATLVSDSGREYKIQAKNLKINVVDSGKFASVACAGGAEAPCVLSPLANKNDTSVTEFEVLQAKKASSSELTNFALKITGGDNPERNPDGYEITIKSGDQVLAKKSAGQTDFVNSGTLKVEQGQQVPLTVELRYPSASLAQENIEAVLSYEVSSSGQTTKRELALVFDTGVAKNFFAIAGLAILVYLLSLLIPYLILLRSKRASAFFYVSDDELAYVNFPVKISKDGVIQSRVSDGEGWEPLKAPHYSKLVKQEIPAKSSKVQVSGLQFVVTANKWNPFAALSLHVMKPGSLIVSSNGSGAGSIQPDMTSTSQSLQDQYFLVFDSDATLSPVTTTQEIDENAEDPFAVTSKSRIEQELNARTSDIEGTLLLLTQTYGNKPKLLSALIDRVNAEISGQTILEDIQGLREKALENAKNVQAIPVTTESPTKPEIAGNDGDEDDWFSSKAPSKDDPFDFGSGSDDFNFGSSSKDDDWKF